MHSSSTENMRYFIGKYMCPQGGDTIVLDVGSQEVPGNENSSYKHLLPEGIRYTGCDMVGGNNVDIILESPYNWKNIRPNQYEYVISGQMLEHVAFPWLTFLEIARVLKRGGICCVIAPSSGPMHNYPLDCYRYYPDGMAALAHYAHLEVLEVFTNYDDNLYPYMDKEWKDTVLIARKPENRFNNWKVQIKRILLHLVSPKSGQKRKTLNPIDYDKYEQPTVVVLRPHIYYDTGTGFSEEQTLYDDTAQISTTGLSCSFELPKAVQNLRFDPVEGSKCLIRNLKITDENGLPLSYTSVNGETLTGGELLFHTIDPQVAIQFKNVPKRVEIKMDMDLITNNLR